ncbi:MAG: hypothetical protein WD734_03820 [Dehalococcoidia bacterium]
MVLIEGSCTLGGGFLRRACGKEPVGQCVYCGAPFCNEHGEHGEDYHEICARPVCQAKYQDVRDHREWIEAHRYRNATSLCGEDGCEERMQHSCQRCRLRFCELHLQMRPVIERRPSGTEKVMLMLCVHCGERRRLWD